VSERGNVAAFYWWKRGELTKEKRFAGRTQKERGKNVSGDKKKGIVSRPYYSN